MTDRWWDRYQIVGGGNDRPLTGDCEEDCQERCAHPGVDSACEVGAIAAEREEVGDEP